MCSPRGWCPYPAAVPSESPGGGGKTVFTPLKPAICYFNAFHASLAAQYFHFNVVRYKQQIPRRLERLKAIQIFGSDVIST